MEARGGASGVNGNECKERGKKTAGVRVKGSDDAQRM